MKCFEVEEKTDRRTEVRLLASCIPPSRPAGSVQLVIDERCGTSTGLQGYSNGAIHAAMTAVDRKPLFWIGSSQKDMRGVPEEVKDVFGSALLDAQYGETPEGARRFGEGLPSTVLKLVEDHEGDTYRAAYTVAFEDAVYVLDVFQKKSKSGRSTPQHVKDRVQARFKAAAEDHERRFGG